MYNALLFKQLDAGGGYRLNQIDRTEYGHYIDDKPHELMVSSSMINHMNS